jgi:hypothetical protein
MYPKRVVQTRVLARAPVPDRADDECMVDVHPLQRLWLARLVLALALVALTAGAFNLTHKAQGAGTRAPAVVAAAPVAVASARTPSGLHGTPGNDALTAPRGGTTIHAGDGADAIASSNGVRDVVDCGAGLDSVTADRIDVLRGCEYVVRVES